MKNNLLLLLFLFTVAVGIQGTEQIRDKFIAGNGRQYNIMQEYPLRLFFDENPDLHPESDVMSTALWRGYIAYFEMDSEFLYLTDIKVLKVDSSHPVSVMDTIFPGKERVVALWYTGLFTFILPKDKPDDPKTYYECKIEEGLIRQQGLIDHYHDGALIYLN